MRKGILVILSGFILLFSFSLSLSQAQSDTEAQESIQLASAELDETPFESPVISMDFQNADLKDVLKLFSQQAGLNFIASENIRERKVSLYLDKVSVEDALNTIMSANNLIYEQKRNSKIFVVKEWGKPDVETITKIFPLQYAKVQGYEFSETSEESSSEEEEDKTNIDDIVAELLTTYGKVIGDPRTNSLIITDLPSQFPKIEQAIKELDIKLPQVMIEAEIVEASLETIDKLGIQWGSASSGDLITGYGAARTTQWPFVEKGEGVGAGGDMDGLYMGYLSAMDLGGIFSMLAKDTDAKILARPRILTLNNETAEINITADTAIASLTETSSSEGIAVQTVSAERVETGVSLTVTPQINKNGEITMSIEPAVTNTKQSSYFADFVDPHTRSAKTTVTVRDGETVIIGGLIKTEEDNVARKIPFLGDIPLLGHIFRRKDDSAKDQELIIFITPHLVKEGGRQPALALERQQMPWEYEGVDLKEQVIEEVLDKFEE